MSFDWPDIPGVRFRPVAHLGGYAVGDDGSVWSLHTRDGTRPPGWHRVSVYRRPYGARYCVVCLRADGGRGKVVCRYVHRLVLEAFVGPCPAGAQALHTDGDTANNRLPNLRWGSASENAEDKRRHGRMPLGTRHGNAKLTEDAVRAIRRLGAEGHTQRAIGARFGVGQTVISSIIRGETWAHVA